VKKYIEHIALKVVG